MDGAMKILCTNGLKSVMLDIEPALQGKSAARPALVWGSTVGLAKEIADGSDGDLAILTAEAIDELVARGEAEIGIQQLSELLPVPGIAIVGPLPEPLQKITTFSAGVLASAKDPSAAQAVARFIATASSPLLQAKGLEPPNI